MQSNQSVDPARYVPFAIFVAAITLFIVIALFVPFPLRVYIPGLLAHLLAYRLISGRWMQHKGILSQTRTELSLVGFLGGFWLGEYPSTSIQFLQNLISCL